MAKTKRRAFRLEQEKWEQLGYISDKLGSDRSTEIRRMVYKFIADNKNLLEDDYEDIF